MNLIQKYPKNNIIYFLTLVIILTTFISEYIINQTVKEGFDLLDMISSFGNMLNDALRSMGDFVGYLFNFGKVILGVFKLIFWVFECIGTLPFFVLWAGKHAVCWLYGIIKLPVCAIWYILQTIGWCLYLPVRFLIFLLDKVLEYIRSSTNTNIPFSFKYMEHFIWCRLEDIDKILFHSYKIHIIHYPESVIEKCYTCPPNPMPEFPPMPQDALDDIHHGF